MKKFSSFLPPNALYIKAAQRNFIDQSQQHGTGEAREAHNLEVDGSKPSVAKDLFFGHLSPLLPAAYKSEKSIRIR
jgi:hypothetical protein